MKKVICCCACCVCCVFGCFFRPWSGHYNDPLSVTIRRSGITLLDVTWVWHWTDNISWYKCTKLPVTERFMRSPITLGPGNCRPGFSNNDMRSFCRVFDKPKLLTVRQLSQSDTIAVLNLEDHRFIEAKFNQINKTFEIPELNSLFSYFADMKNSNRYIVCS